MAKLIIDIPDELHKAIKHKAIEFSQNGSLKNYVVDVLQKAAKE